MTMVSSPEELRGLQTNRLNQYIKSYILLKIDLVLMIWVQVIMGF